MSPFISDADYLPETGNILITDGGRIRDEEGNLLTVFNGHKWARILEVTHTSRPEKIWEVVIDDPVTSYSAYRAQRFRSLYPKRDRATG